VVVAAPPGVVTVTCPLEAGDVVIARDVGLDEVTGATRELTRTRFIVGADSKFVPLIVRVEPGTPIDGEKPEMVGEVDPTRKLVGLVAFPPGLVTATGPDVAPAGTVATI
jgi:hypothetical protein